MTTSLPVLVLAATKADGLAVANAAGVSHFTVITPRTRTWGGHIFRALILTPSFARLLHSGDRVAGDVWAVAQRDALKSGVR